MKTRNYPPEIKELFFGSLKQERVHWRNYRTRYAAQQDVINYIGWMENNLPKLFHNMGCIDFIKT